MTDQRPPARREDDEPSRDPGAYIGNRPARPTQTGPGGPRRVPAPGRRRTEPPAGIRQRDETSGDAESAERRNEAG